MSANRAARVRSYAEQFHRSLSAGMSVEEVVVALADACKRAIEDETPPRTKDRQRKIALYARSAEALDAAAAKIREST